MGIPLSRNQYIHRLGRTGREGKEGEGMLIIAPWEEYFLGELKDIPLENFTLPHLDANAKLKVIGSLISAIDFLPLCFLCCEIETK